MARRYGHPISITLSSARPSRFRWRDADYRIVEVLSTWHLRDRWWEPSSAGGTSDRLYYRVRCAGEQIFELYHDLISDSWVLDRIHD